MISLIACQGGLPLITYVPKGRGGSSLRYISIVYYLLKGGEGVQIACKIAYVINGGPQAQNDGVDFITGKYTIRPPRTSTNEYRLS